MDYNFLNVPRKLNVTVSLYIIVIATSANNCKCFDVTCRKEKNKKKKEISVSFNLRPIHAASHGNTFTALSPISGYLEFFLSKFSLIHEKVEWMKKMKMFPLTMYTSLKSHSYLDCRYIRIEENLRMEIDVITFVT
ncbi:hypothetical protein PVAND_012139 [Polypedilum vanderplanki]|uniref:Uncharacterized protein n=1 Tax=Polypedilum vanderplanki TaxID=319348 RepID=A0A9J6CLI6_POLVA|nr:hypothetical protein PVAND_012139 [Polypedilum vanderplanki]